MKVTLEIRVAGLVGNHWLAVANVGGIDVRGGLAGDPGSAIRSLFEKLSGNGRGQNVDDAIIAVDLLAAGQTMESMGLKALTAGSDDGEAE